MADNYPLPVFHFTVDWEGGDIAFSEVSGLNIESQAIEYRDGKSTETIKLPGIRKFGNLTLKRGVFKGETGFYDWWFEHVADRVKRRDLTITLDDENLEPVVTYTVSQAFVVKVEGASLKATGNEVAVESIEVAHEGLTIAAS